MWWILILLAGTVAVAKASATQKQAAESLTATKAALDSNPEVLKIAPRRTLTARSPSSAEYGNAGPKFISLGQKNANRKDLTPKKVTHTSSGGGGGISSDGSGTAGAGFGGGGGI